MCFARPLERAATWVRTPRTQRCASTVGRVVRFRLELMLCDPMSDLLAHLCARFAGRSEVHAAPDTPVDRFVDQRVGRIEMMCCARCRAVDIEADVLGSVEAVERLGNSARAAAMG